MSTLDDVRNRFGYRSKIVLLEIDDSSIESATKGWTIYQKEKGILNPNTYSKSVVLDVVAAHEISMDAKPTIHTVEKGADITDHVKPGTKEISLSATLADMDFVGISFGTLGDKSLKDKLNLLESWVENSKTLFYLGYSSDELEIPVVVITQLKITKPLKTGELSRNLQINLAKIHVVSSKLSQIQIKANVTKMQGTDSQTSSQNKDTVANKTKSSAHQAVSKPKGKP